MFGKDSAPAPNYNNSPWGTGQPQTRNTPGVGGGPLMGHGQYMGPDGKWHDGSPPQAGPDFYGAAGYDSAERHADQSNPYGSSTWAQDPTTHQWHQNVAFSGGMNTANEGLEHQIAGLGDPLDTSSLPGVSSGEGTRQRAEDAIYGRETSRLDPQWKMREEAERNRLVNSGLDPASEAFKNEMGTFGRDRNDAYSTAQRDSIMGGGAEASREFSMDMQRRQQMLGEMLRRRELPLNEMEHLRSFLEMPGTPQGGNYLGATTNLANYGLNQSSQANQFGADVTRGATTAAATIPFLI